MLLQRCSPSSLSCTSDRTNSLPAQFSAKHISKHAVSSVQPHIQSCIRMMLCSASSSTRSTDNSVEPLQPGTSGKSGKSGQEGSNSSSSSSSSSSSKDLVTFYEMQEIAVARGLHLSLKTLGPFYRITCRDGGSEGRIVGVTNGFVAPLFGLIHCDTLQIFTRGMKGEEADRVRKNALGLGLLLGGAVFSYGRSCGCKKAEILAINDDDAWHERLVRYYSYFGFKPVCKVGGQGFFQDLPHLLVWGGEGTRMDADIDEALQRWTAALRQSRQKAQKQQQSRAEAAAGAGQTSS